ncbi:MAG: BTAD domain-containing putative transcriptional regulator [Acidimicrobiia bacterium]
MSLQIRLLGGLLIESNGRIFPRIASRPGRSLFAYLVLNRDRQIARDHLAGLFWPDMPDSQARRRLSQALWHIQTLLAEEGAGGSYLLTSPGTVRFNPASDYWLDVEEFETATDSLKQGGPGADPARLAEAMNLYRGDLLTGFYDEWVQVDQQRLRHRYFQALAHIANLHKSRGEFEQALVYARRLALLDPLREDAHRDVMRLCLLAGRANEALLQYEVCYSALADELGAEPEAATTELFESIAAQRREGRRPFVPAPRSPLFDPGVPVAMVGREHLRAEAVAAIESALAGSGGVVLVEGEPGVGKTRLLEGMADDANWRGFNVLWGEAPDDEVAGSFHPLASALEGALSPIRSEQLRAQVGELWLGVLSRLLPTLRDWLPDIAPVASLEPSEEAGRMREAITRSVTGLARVTPQLLILDDFQWADDDTIAAVSHLAGALAQAPIVVCVAYRSQDARRRPVLWDAVRELDATPRSRRLPVEALSPVETDELIRVSSATQGTPDLVERIHSETGGNPLFVLETLRAIHEHNLAVAATEIDGFPGDFPVPATVQDLISRRLETLAAADRAVLDLFAVAGLESDPSVLVSVLDRPRPEVFESLDLLVRRGILFERGSRYRFRHEQVRRVVNSDLASERAAELHGAIAESLIERDPDAPEPIAHHLSAAGRHSSAAPYAVLSAERATEVQAYAAAASHYRVAVEAGDASMRTLLAFESVLDVLGRRSEQAVVIDDLLAAGRTGEPTSEAKRRHAWYLAHTDDFDEAASAGAEALEADESADDREGMADDLMVLGMAALWSGEPAQAVGHLEQAVPLSSSAVQQARSRRALGTALSAVQEYEQADEEARTALELFGAAGDPRGEAEALGLLGIITMERGRAADAVAFYERAIDLCRQIGYRHGEAVNTANQGNALWYAGRISEALDAFAAAVDMFGSMGNRRGRAMVQANAASIHHSVVGDDATAAAYCRSALGYFTEVGNEDGAAQVQCNLADIARRAGDLPTAASHIRLGLASVQRAGNRWLEVQLLYSQAQLLMAGNTFGEAEATAGAALELCREFGLADFESGLISMAGLARMELGDIDGAIAAMDEAVAKLQSGSDQDYLVPYRRGVVLEAAGRMTEADRAFAHAESLLSSRIGGLPPEQRRTALAIPDHQSILEAAARRRSRMIDVRLARRDVPTGRTLRDDDLVDVAWTVADPTDETIGSGAELRRHRLRRLLDEARAHHAAPTISDLADALDASVRTIRRDLQALRQAGVSVETRGTRQSQAST